jgi:hypothetical protein
MFTFITFYWIRQLSSTTLTDPVTFGGRQLFVPVLHSAGTDSYLKCPVQENVIQVHITLVLRMLRDQCK